jgi:uncharacterized protein (DUF1015 family)
MIRLHPFTALRPSFEDASEVSSDPYDVISTSEARERAAGKPKSFLHVVRSEIDLPEGTDCYATHVYEKASGNLQSMIANGVLQRESQPSIYLYQQIREGIAQVGIVGCVEAEQYRSGGIRKHEKTRPDKEDDRTRHLLATACHAEPVFLCFRDEPNEGTTIHSMMEADMQSSPLFAFVAPDGVQHTGWSVSDPVRYVSAFGQLNRLYIADGHHRSAGAERAATASKEADANGSGDKEYGRFLAVVFPHDQLRILPYNRVVADLNGLSAEEFLSKLRALGSLEQAQAGTPEKPGQVLVFVDGEWWLLTFPESSIDRNDPIASLDVALLQDRVLAPLLGIGDPRTDSRIAFVGGVRGCEELERRAGDQGIAFSMHATSADELLAVADADEIMPPKSTWFEPKLRSGLFVHEFERVDGAKA